MTPKDPGSQAVGVFCAQLAQIRGLVTILCQTARVEMRHGHRSRRSIMGEVDMQRLLARNARMFSIAAATALAVSGLVPTAQAAGDLLVAPTRIVLDGRRGAEVILNNIGSEEATYRISLELRRMNDNGKLEDILPEAANDKEKAALEIIRFAPRRVTLPPNQPQSIRVGMQSTETLPDGEYRAHMLFRAIPKTADVTAENGPGNGLKINLIPVYGVTIPVIIRKGELKATAAIANATIVRASEGESLQFALSRKGDRSVFGEVHVTRPGLAEPLLVAKGIAVYPELDGRTVTLPLDAQAAAKMPGDVIISYYEAAEAGGALIAQLRTTLR
jgi:P pilus assembly chaperone PapD